MEIKIDGEDIRNSVREIIKTKLLKIRHYDLMNYVEDEVRKRITGINDDEFKEMLKDSIKKTLEKFRVRDLEDIRIRLGIKNEEDN